MSMKSVLAEELKRISVSREDIASLNGIARDFIKSLKKKGLKAFVGGSLAKGTMIRKTSFSKIADKGSQIKGGTQDVDIFVVFDYSEDIAGLESILNEIELPGELKKVHGSRDYFQIVCFAPKGVPPAQIASADADKVGSVLLEVIPVVKNADPELAENVTDVSLSHVKYVGGEVKKNVGIADEIKLAKAFCRANRCYGAEGYVRGFSGYSLEVLVIYFGGFVKFLRGIRKSKVIDPCKYFKSGAEVMREVNASKLQGPLVVIDPTYKFRNVCAGLGFETFGKFVDVANNFLKRPSLDFFEYKGIDIEALRDLTVGSRKFVEVEFSTERQEGDIAGTKMKKVLDFFVRELERKGQVVLRKEFDYLGGQKAKGYLVVVEKKEIEIRGPSVGLADVVEKFLKAKGDRAFKRKGFWWFRESVSVEGVFGSVKKVMREMGAEMKIRK